MSDLSMYDIEGSHLMLTILFVGFLLLQAIQVVFVGLSLYHAHPVFVLDILRVNACS